MSSMNMPGNLPQLPNVVDESEGARNPSPTASTNPVAVSELAAAPATGQVAQDLDTIEEIWVHRVEQLMHQYGDDPQKLSEEFNHLKTEYIATRYGKQIGKS